MTGRERRGIDWGPVDARLARAQHHVAELDAAVAAFVALPPYRRRKAPTATGTVIDRADGILPAPRELAMIASDAFHQARAALDNAVGVMRPGGPTRHSGYPVVAREEDYKAVANSALAGVPKWARDLIREQQPFAVGAWRWVGERLALLSEAARLDRHQAPAVHVALLRPDYVAGVAVEFRGDLATWAEVEYRPRDVASVHFEVVVTFADGPLRDGDVVSGTRWITGIAATVIEQLRLAEPADQSA